MQYNLYKPNSKNSGAAVGFKILKNNDSEPTFGFEIIKQSGWNEKSKTGSFKGSVDDPEKRVFVKLNEHEVGALIEAIERRTPFSAFHSFGADKTQISFKTYVKRDGSKAFSLGVVKNTTLKFGLGIELGEARALKVYLERFLNALFAYEDPSYRASGTKN